ncbi:hypothetical protein LQ567_00635 [Niabella pedocola]|uniref:ASCH domain-containing protein n=1 Tax=Niabella pedocola TaxID=1752077 RepID=A0ABS8PJI0_9BACT|nr:hypothetical protein [Niabella pedocola]MCD2421248.1 hypothetical protein [Niabella pedocola]
MKVLLSIKPEFANKIFEGTKLFEFRRSIFKNTNVKKVVVYASSPVQKVIGEFEIDFILKSKLEELWNETQEFSGITREYFFQYFSNKEEGFAIKIKNQRKYKHPKSLKDDYNLLPPQSFLYLS